MSVNYSKQFANRPSRRVTPQSQPIPGSTQVPNSAGGFTWEITPAQQFERFVVLGAEGGTYYIGERDLIKLNHDKIVGYVKSNGLDAVQTLVDISVSGRAYKNDPAIFALALALTHGDKATKSAAAEALPKVCRIGTHLFHFAEYINAMRGWGRALTKAVARWYTEREADQLAYQAIKYQQRDGWSHADLLRLSHPVAASEAQDALFRWLVKAEFGDRVVQRKPNKAGQKAVASKYTVNREHLPVLIDAFEKAKVASKASEIVKLITESNLPREAIPTQFLTDLQVWDALLQKMPMTAMIRNLGKMTSMGLVKPLSEASKLVVERLGSEAALRKARIHPMAVLIAMKVYAQGHGEKGDLRWSPVAKITDALDKAFYAAFKNVEPCGKPLLLALDVSGSMAQATISGTCLSAREASAAMALVTAATEPQCEIIAFSAPSGGGYGGMHGGGEPGITQVNLSSRMRLDDVIKKVSSIPLGGTDCSLPMVWARRNKLKVSGFVTYTDSETWAGVIQPSQALRDYRNQYVQDAKAVVVGMTANSFTLADPDDAGMLDVVGFDSSVPSVISDFIRGKAGDPAVESVDAP